MEYLVLVQNSKSITVGCIICLAIWPQKDYCDLFYAKLKYNFSHTNVLKV